MGEARASGATLAPVRRAVLAGAQQTVVAMTSAENVQCKKWYVHFQSADNYFWLQSPKEHGKGTTSFGTSLQQTWPIDPQAQYIFNFWDLDGCNKCYSQVPPPRLPNPRTRVGADACRTFL